MTAALILNIALAIPVFVVIVGLAHWSFRSQHGDRPHVFVRSRRPRLAARPAPPARPAPAAARRQAAWPAH